MFLPYANNKGADQPVHPPSLISTFIVRCLDSTIPLVSIHKISSLYLAFVAEQASLSLPWLQTQMKGFLVTGLICNVTCRSDQDNNFHNNGHDVSHVTKNLSSEVCNQVRLKPACSANLMLATLGFSNIVTIGIMLSRQRTTKVLIRLSRLICIFVVRIWHEQVFSWQGSVMKQFMIKLRFCSLWP